MKSLNVLGILLDFCHKKKIVCKQLCKRHLSKSRNICNFPNTTNTFKRVFGYLINYYLFINLFMQSQKNLEKDKTRIYNDKISVEGQLEKKQIELKQCKQVGNVLINKFSLRPSC